MQRWQRSLYVSSLDDLDFAGVPNGNAKLDSCGVCDDGGTSCLQKSRPSHMSERNEADLRRILGNVNSGRTYINLSRSNFLAGRTTATPVPRLDSIRLKKNPCSSYEATTDSQGGTPFTASCVSQAATASPLSIPCTITKRRAPFARQTRQRLSPSTARTNVPPVGF